MIAPCVRGGEHEIDVVRDVCFRCGRTCEEIVRGDLPSGRRRFGGHNEVVWPLVRQLRRLLRGAPA